ncbi:MAG: nascent polypeptide-associated complex protein [Thermoplasmata archaeon]|nr:nascent polypeptide-associated complex protein [Thermoplasmata archaeon]
MPGMRGVNPRQMQQAMKKMGITQEEWDDVDEVIISRAGKSYVFKKPAVTAVKMQGQNTFQIIGDYNIVEGKVQALAPQQPKGIVIPDEDVELVASQANVSPEEARKALEECNGEPAEAIIKLMSR